MVFVLINRYTEIIIKFYEINNIKAILKKFYTKFKENLSNKLKFLNKICRITQSIFI